MYKESEESLFKLTYLNFYLMLILIKENHCSTETKPGKSKHRNITFRFNLDNAINASLLKCQRQ